MPYRIGVAPTSLPGARSREHAAQTVSAPSNSGSRQPAIEVRGTGLRLALVLLLGVAGCSDAVRSGVAAPSVHRTPAGFPARAVRALPALPTVSVGSGQACVVKQDQSVVCWGGNSYGEGVGIPGAFSQVSATDHNTCGLRADGTINCWGEANVLTATPSGTFAQLSAGRYHGCALNASGVATCWGNGFQQPREYAGPFQMLSAGWDFTCAMRDDATLACWGNNQNGRSEPPPGAFRDVDAGLEFACGIRTSGAIVCWGYTPDLYLPAGQGTPPSGTFTQVSAGFQHACAIRGDGTVACWGQNNNGRASPPIGTFREVSAGYYTTCGVRTGGAVECWPAMSGMPVLNLAPSANAGGSYVGTEGSAITFDGSASTDPEGALQSYEWDWDGDGAFDAVGVQPTHTFPQDGSYLVTLRVTDAAGATSTATASVMVANVTPTVTVSASLDPLGLVAGQAIAAVNVSFSDPGALDPHTATVDCGNGTAAWGTPMVCTYTAAGVYAVRATVTDDHGAGTARFEYVVVYDPSGGFVTGGGWITSPDDACSAGACNVTTAGKASFGFVAKYQPGRNTPDGNTRFQFHAGEFDFQSSDYVTLVVSGNRAQYWGTGTVNGAAGYTFRVTAVDGQVVGNDGSVDRFRIEVWASGDGGQVGTGQSVYDNQRGAGQADPLKTPLGGGNIAIKR
jgi:PKD repeat protein